MDPEKTFQFILLPEEYARQISFFDCFLEVFEFFASLI